MFWKTGRHHVQKQADISVHQPVSDKIHKHGRRGI